MYAKIFTDQQLAHYFVATNKEKQKARQKIYLANVLGAPIEWHGRTMI